MNRVARDDFHEYLSCCSTDCAVVVTRNESQGVVFKICSGPRRGFPSMCKKAYTDVADFGPHLGTTRKMMGVLAGRLTLFSQLRRVALLSKKYNSVPTGCQALAAAPFDFDPDVESFLLRDTRIPPLHFSSYQATGSTAQIPPPIYSQFIV